MVLHRLRNLTMLAVFLSPPSGEAAADSGHAAELVRLHVVKVNDLPPRRLPGNAGHIQMLFERQTTQGLIALMRLEIEGGAIALNELLRPEMTPELVYVLQGLIELGVPDSKAKPRLAAGELLYRPNRSTKLSWNGKSRQPVRLLLWAVVPTPSVPLPPAEPIFRSIHGAREYGLPGGKGVTKVALDQRIAPKAFASLELLTLRQRGAIPEHVHQTQAEILFVTQGSGILTLQGQAVSLGPGHAVYLPPGVAHSFKATSKEVFTALRSYLPPGPEQRVQLGQKP